MSLLLKKNAKEEPYPIASAAVLGVAQRSREAKSRRALSRVVLRSVLVALESVDYDRTVRGDFWCYVCVILWSFDRQLCFGGVYGIGGH